MRVAVMFEVEFPDAPAATTEEIQQWIRTQLRLVESSIPVSNPLVEVGMVPVPGTVAFNSSVSAVVWVPVA